MKNFSISCFLILCGWCSPVWAESLVKNSGFEAGMDSWTYHGGSAGASGGVLPQAGLDGGNIFQIVQPADTAEAGAASLIQSISGLMKGSSYQLSVWLKGNQSGAGFLEGNDQRVALPTGTFDWTQVTVVFKPSTDSVSIGLYLTGKTDELWVGRVAVVPMENRSDTRAAQAEKYLGILDKLQKTAAANSNCANDEEIKAGLLIAARYIQRLETGGPGGTQGMRGVQPGSYQVWLWNDLQAREIGTVLDRVGERVKSVSSGEITPYQMPVPIGGHMTFDADGFLLKETGGKTIPVNPGGYGFFRQVVDDIDFLEPTGTQLVQQEHGPRDLSETGNLSAGALSIQPFLAQMALRGVFADVLLSPHYFPAWAVQKNPEVKLDQWGALKYKIDHPAARSVVEQWINTFVPLVTDSSALQSLCLSNEPSYSSSGRDPDSAAKWPGYLQKRHGTIETLNERYGSHYQSFNDVPVPALAFPTDPAQWVPYYDWVRFNQQNFADWHRWMYDLVKAKAPNVPVHSKLVPDIFDTGPQARRSHGGLLSNGVDPELIEGFTDLAGCDSWNFIGTHDEYTHSWLRTQIWYDLLNSFHQRPVIDSELHLILDRYPAESIPPEHFYNVLWEGALHHRSAFIIWIWSEPASGSSQGDIYLRPAAIYATSRAMIDLDRLAPEIRTINHEPAQVAIVYSMTSLFWESRYSAATKNLYATLTFLGYKVTFVSETQLESGMVPGVTAIFLPEVTHIEDGAAKALMQLTQKGMTLIPVGDDNLAFNDYNQPRATVTLPPAIFLDKGQQADMETVASALGDRMKKIPKLQVVGSGERAYGVDYRVVTVPDGKLVSLVSVLAQPQRLQVKGLGEGVDLISSRKINLADFTLAPRETLLVKVTK